MAVSRFEIALRRPLAGGASFTSPAGEVGPYEELKGRLHFAIDPTALRQSPHHRRGARPLQLRGPRRVGARTSPSCCRSIARSAAGASARRRQPRQYRCGAEFQPRLPPAVRRRARIRTRPSTSGDGFLMRARLRRDLVRLAGRRPGDSGPLPDAPARGPECAGSPAPRTRPLAASVLGPVPQFLLSDRGHIPYPAADLEETGAVLTVRDMRRRTARP